MAVPTSTYRLQIRAEFDLDAAGAVLDFLVALGAGAVYLSPLLTANRGSDHGYDVVDHSTVDPARGGPEGLCRLVEAAHSRGLGVVVDIVPNHMGVADAAQNAQWWDMLRAGPDSPCAPWFDVDWSNSRVMLPVLGGDDAELTVDGAVVRYHEKTFPLAPGTDAAEAVEKVLAEQHYELAPYTEADTRQNYRRFFAVTELAGLRVEDRAVFDATHREITRWVEELGIDGLRVDHPDGLRDPEGYLRRLREIAPHAWITVEKITEPGETLLSSWPVDGMTGYDALVEVTNLFVDPAGEAEFTAVQVQLTGDERDWPTHMADGKRMIATTLLRAEALRLGRLAADEPRAVDALTELAAGLPVYRTYAPAESRDLDEALARLPEELRPTGDRLLPRLRDPHDELALRFQQFTGAVMAKGVEDTAYYRYNRLGSLTEVGGDPATFGAPVAAFHAAAARRQQDSPHGMTTLSTHDTKRGEDVRAFQDVVAEFPREWAATLRELQRLAPVPNPAFAALLWQTFVGTARVDRSARFAPIERDRMHAYLEKAMREAGDGTSWRAPDEAFESAVHAAADAGYDDPAVRAVLQQMIDLVAPHGFVVALGQKLVQLTMPGVPDVYQGTDMWEDSLVDPDNRRPVDLAAHARLLAELDAAGTPPPLDGTGRAKLWVVSRALRTRRAHPEWFGAYRPLTATGPAADHLVAFDRGGVIALATRLPAGLERCGGWAETSLPLPAGRFSDVLTGRPASGTVAVADVLASLPVALLRPAGAAD